MQIETQFPLSISQFIR